MTAEQASWSLQMVCEFRRSSFLFLMEHSNAANILQELIAQGMLTEDEVTTACGKIG